MSSPVPDNITANVEWSYIGTALSTVSNDFNFVRLKLNAIYDCGAALTSSDAKTIANYPVVYSAYVVTESSIQVDVVNTDTDVPFRLTVVPSLQEPTLSSLWTSDAPLLVAPYSKSIIVGNANGFDKGSIKMTCDVGKLAGLGRLNTRCYEYTGVTTADSGGVALDPVELGGWIVAIQAVGSATDNLDAVLSIKIIYRTIFYNAIVPYVGDTSLSSIPESLKERHAYYAQIFKKRDRRERNPSSQKAEPNKLRLAK